jgi:hypothetical protein
MDDATVDQAGEVSETGATGNDDFPTSESYGTVFETEATFGGSGTSMFGQTKAELMALRRWGTDVLFENGEQDWDQFEEEITDA